MLKHPKSYYRKFKHNGYKWQGFAEGLHHFSRKEINPNVPYTAYRYACLQCLESDLGDGTFIDLAEYDTQRPNGFTEKDKRILNGTDEYL